MKFRGNTDAQVEEEAREAFGQRVGDAEGSDRMSLLHRLYEEASSRLPPGFSQRDQGYACSMGYDDESAKMSIFDGVMKQLVEDALEIDR